MAARLKIEGLSCTRGGRPLFEGLDVVLEPGQALLVLGPNGAGKSSLLRVIAGLLPPTAGRVEAEGRMAFADRNTALDCEETLAGALGFWARLDGGDAAEGLAAMALTPLASVPVRMLSSGQRQRAALARVIAAQADLWLLDEPSNALDEASVARLEAAIAGHRAGGGIVVVASHLPLVLLDAKIIILGGGA